MIVAAVLLGVAIGVLSGLLGVGGGTIMVPMFRLAFNMSALASTATSLFTIIPTSISGIVAHVRNKTCVPKLGIAMGLGGACTSPLGVWLASISPSWAVMLAAALVIGYSAFTMLRKALSAPKAASGVGGGAASPNSADVAASAVPTDGHASSSSGQGAPFPASIAVEACDSAMPRGVGSATPAEPGSTAAATPSQAVPPAAQSFEPTVKQLVVGALIGLVAGVASGYVGLGGGFLMVPLMLTWVGMPMRLASGTSLIGIMLLAIPGVVEHGILGNIDYLAGIATAVGTVPGAFLGARLVSRVPERTLRLLFSAFLGIGAIMLVAKEVVLLV